MAREFEELQKGGYQPMDRKQLREGYQPKTAPVNPRPPKGGTGVVLPRPAQAPTTRPADLPKK